MKRVCILAALIIPSFAWLSEANSTAGPTSVAHALVASAPLSESQLRIAIVGLAAKPTADSRAVEAALTEALGRDARVLLLDASMVEPALKALAYDGSINLSTDWARRLASAIGCDFFVVGKAEALTRSEREKESHEEAYAGVIFVDARDGSLAAFDFISEKASTREAALTGVVKRLGARADGYIDRLIQLRVSALISSSKASSTTRDSSTIDFSEDIPDEGSARSTGFKPPQFLNRVKPEYTREAESADITATVEARVIFRSNGEIGEITITQWAGFGLEESAERAIHQLKFKPATRDGKPVSIRAVVRYNFRRVSEPSSKSEQPSPKPPEIPERELRQLTTSA
jgi:TonB family protein